MCSLFYLKAKNEEMKWRNEETRKNILFTIKSSPFLKNKKNTRQTLILSFIFDNCSLMWKEGLCQLSKK